MSDDDIFCPYCSSRIKDTAPPAVCATCGGYTTPPAGFDLEQIAAAAGVPVEQVMIRRGADGRPVIDLHNYRRTARGAR